MGDAALTVAVTSGAGAILGASTLPFYGEPDKHKKNIFYGASFGAIIGVLIAAYAGFQESADAEMAARNYRFIAPDTSSVLVSKSTSVISVNESLAFIPATLFRF